MAGDLKQEVPPKPDTPQVKVVKDDIGEYKAIAAIANQEGGKLLIDKLKKEILDGVDTIMDLAKGSEIDLRCAVVKLKANVTLLRVLNRAPENARLAEEELSKLLKEESI